MVEGEGRRPPSPADREPAACADEECEWFRLGNAVRFIDGWPCPTVVILPASKAVALLPTGVRDDERAAMFRKVLADYWFRLYGRPDVRAHLRAYLRQRDGDNLVA